MTDVSVEFKVSGNLMIQQSPQNLPPVYEGEKLVVYGIVTPKEGYPLDQELSGKAILRGQLLGEMMEHSVPLTYSPTSVSQPSLPTIHHLAAKALIKDWQDREKSKEEIVKLSVESSVISSHTAFLAINEEISEPVSHAMKIWDVQSRYTSACAAGGTTFDESKVEYGVLNFSAMKTIEKKHKDGQVPRSPLSISLARANIRKLKKS